MDTSGKKSTVIAAAVFGLLVLVAIVARFFTGGGGSYVGEWERGKAEKQEAIRQAKEAIGQADALWDGGKTAEAITAYKQVIREFGDALDVSLLEVDSGTIEDTTTARLFRRVIEYELQYGDKGEARDFMVEAIHKYGIRDELSMDTPEGRQLLEDVVGRGRNNRDEHDGSETWRTKTF